MSRCPRLLVLLDGYAAFAAAFERVNARRACRCLAAPRRRRAPARRPLRDHRRPARCSPERADEHRPGTDRATHGRRRRVRGARRAVKTVRGTHRCRPVAGSCRGGIELQCALAGDDRAGQAAPSPRPRRRSARAWRRGPADRTVPDARPAADACSPPDPLAAALGLADEELAPVVDLSRPPFPRRRALPQRALDGARDDRRSLARRDPVLELHLARPAPVAAAELDCWTLGRRRRTRSATRAARCSPRWSRREVGTPAAGAPGRRRRTSSPRAHGALPLEDVATPRPRPRGCGSSPRRAALQLIGPSPAGSASFARTSTACCSFPTSTSTATCSAFGCRGGAPRLPARAGVPRRRGRVELVQVAI